MIDASALMVPITKLAMHDGLDRSFEMAESKKQHKLLGKVVTGHGIEAEKYFQQFSVELITSTAELSDVQQII